METKRKNDWIAKNSTAHRQHVGASGGRYAWQMECLYLTNKNKKR